MADENDVRDHFFSGKNMNFTYGIIRQEVNSKCGYDIDKSPKLKEGFDKMAQTIYIKTEINERNLTILNSNLVQQCSSYFTKLIDKKKGKSSNVSGNSISNRLEDRNMLERGENTRTNVSNGMSIANKNEDIAKNLQNLEQLRAMDLADSRPTHPIETVDSNNSNRDMDSRYQNIMGQRTDAIKKEERGNTTGRGMAEIYEPNSLFSMDMDSMDTLSNNSLPFTMSNEFISNGNGGGNGGGGNNIYDNTNDLLDRDSKNPMEFLETYQRNRDGEILIEQGLGENATPDAMKKIMNTRPMDDLSSRRNQQLKDSRIDSVSADPRKLMLQNQDITNRMINNMTSGQVGNNGALANPNYKTESDKTINKMVDYQIENEPSYIDKVHYININSIDRNWKSQQESRYQFKINFNPSSTQENAGVTAIFKNIVSVELINAMMPLDSSPLLFDNRIYLSTHRHPYLLLQIDELDGVFRSTNSASDKVFSQMIFDKEFNTDVLSSDYIGSDVAPTPDTRFSSQFKRGYLRYIPAFFEKKNYGSNPIASLNRMTIKITDLYGNLINEENDTLEVTAITAVTVGAFELTATLGFPASNVSAHKYIRLTTDKYFNNRLFRIGDTIRFSSVSSDNTTMDDFLNRESGHVIINLTAETNTATGNKSYINQIYISPPGNLDSSNQTIDASTYIDASTVTFETFSSVATGTTIAAYVVNQSLQTNLMMKIVTRDVDTSNIIKSLNV